MCLDSENCMQKCKEVNTNQNVPYLMQELQECCQPECHSEVSYHTAKRTIIIVFAVLCFVMIILCCMFGFFGPAVKKSIVYREEKKKRKIVIGQTSQSVFQERAHEFANIFSEDKRDYWSFSFTTQDQTIGVEWLSVKMWKQSPYCYTCKIKAQDIKGVWYSEGQFLQTITGPTLWGLKNYEPQDNNPISFDQQSSIVFELFRNNDGSYFGRWYNRNDGRHGECFIHKKQSMDYSHETTSQKFDSNSIPQTDENF